MGQASTIGQWSVEPAELHRVYPPADTIVADNDAQAPIALPRNDAAGVEIREIRALLATTEARLADAQDQIVDLRRRLDAADAERRQTAERLTALLTDQREQPSDHGGRGGGDDVAQDTPLQPGSILL